MEWSSYLLNDIEKFRSYQVFIRNKEWTPSSRKLSVTAIQLFTYSMLKKIIRVMIRAAVDIPQPM